MDAYRASRVVLDLYRVAVVDDLERHRLIIEVDLQKAGGFGSQRLLIGHEIADIEDSLVGDVDRRLVLPSTADREVFSQ